MDPPQDREIVEPQALSDLYRSEGFLFHAGKNVLNLVVGVAMFALPLCEGLLIGLKQEQI